MRHAYRSAHPPHHTPLFRILGAGTLLLLLGAAEVQAIPAFARKYKVSCALCHNPVPTLTEFGNAFAGNGFRFASNEPPRDTVDTNDDLLDLMKDLPLALRMDIYGQTFTNGETAPEFQAPYNIKILTGGPISRKISYYLYFFLFERGEIGGIEDAYIYIDDIGGGPYDLMIGQFQVSDPMFKRELRLTFADYVIYRTRVGDQVADLTYDRGILGIASPGSFTISAEVINGNGIAGADLERRLDNDPFKNFFAHVTSPVIPELRLGVMGYYGRQRGQQTETAPEVTNNLWMAGADATLALGLLELNLQYIHREDDQPTFQSDESKAKTDGGFAEAIYRFRGGRWYAIALYNLIHCSEPLLDVRLGAPPGISRFQQLTLGGGHVLKRNIRLMGELAVDFEQDFTRWTLGIVTAF